MYNVKLLDDLGARRRISKNNLMGCKIDEKSHETQKKLGALIGKL